MAVTLIVVVSVTAAAEQPSRLCGGSDAGHVPDADVNHRAQDADLGVNPGASDVQIIIEKEREIAGQRVDILIGTAQVDPVTGSVDLSDLPVSDQDLPCNPIPPAPVRFQPEP
ncbi:MAG: hypothetical protein Alpg2KO_28880 [Alphaproteobacteria bacterium]